MGTAENRMDKVAKSLTPKQAVIAWMEEAHQFKSLSEYGFWLAEQPEATGLQALTQRVEIGLRDRMQGEPAEKVEKLVRAAVRDTAFLYFLHLQVNQYFDSQSRAIELMGLLLLERARAAPPEATLTQSCADRDDNLREDLRSYLIEVFSLKAATEQLAKRYFDHNQVLWKSFAEQLEHFIRLINGIIVSRENAYFLAYWSRHSGKKRYLGNRDRRPPHFNFDLLSPA